MFTEKIVYFQGISDKPEHDNLNIFCSCLISPGLLVMHMQQMLEIVSSRQILLLLLPSHCYFAIQHTEYFEMLHLVNRWIRLMLRTPIPPGRLNNNFFFFK